MQITAIRPFVARFDNRLRVVVKVGTDEGLYIGNAGAGGAGRIAERELSAGRVCGPYAGSPASAAGGGWFGQVGLLGDVVFPANR